MNTVIASLLIAVMLPIVCSWISGYFRYQQFGKGFDNKLPRLQAAKLTGAGARAVAAQGNSWEALALFSAAVLAVLVSGIPMAEIANLALAFAALRIIYIALYLANKDALRSLVFLGGFGICMYLFYLALST